MKKSIGLLLGLAGLLGLAAGVAPAQPQPWGVNPAFVQVGRYVLVKVDGGNITILDTGTGDLYKATDADVKKYSDRPKVGGGVIIRPAARPELKKEKDAPEVKEPPRIKVEVFPGGRAVAPFAQVARYALVKAEGGNVILLDTATGDLYKASDADLKKHSERPRAAGGIRAQPGELPKLRGRGVDEEALKRRLEDVRKKLEKLRKDNR
jgi:hypothetical protein